MTASAWSPGSLAVPIYPALAAANGASLVGGGVQIVTSIAALRLLLKTSPSVNAYVTGYYSAGDGGGGFYRYDPTDVVSGDNAGTIIVAADGGRWKLVGQEDWVSIKQFGAKMNDLANDGPAIQAAVNWVLSLPVGGAVYIPSGIARITTNITIPNTLSKSFTMFGDGGASQIRAAATMAMFVVGDATPQFGSIRVLRDFTIAQAFAANVTAFQAVNANSTTFQRLFVYNTNNAIVLQACFNIHINQCQIYGAAANAITTAVTGTNALFVTDCSISTCGVGVNIVSGGNNIVVRNNDIEACGIAVAMTNYTSVEISGNYIENGTNVVFFFSGTNAEVNIIQNWLGQNAVSTSIQLIAGGKFSQNTIFQSTWTESGTSDFLFGRNYLLGGGVVPVTKWTGPALINGFSNTGGVYPLSGYIRDDNGFVHLRGMVQAAADAVAFQLPVGYRPPAQQTFASIATNGTLARVNVSAAGNVTVFRGTDTTCDLSNVHFQSVS